MALSPFANYRTIVRPRKVRRRSGWFSGILILVLMLWIGWFITQNGVQSQLQARLQSTLDEMFADSQISAKINKAEFVEGEGIRLNDSSVVMFDLRQPEVPLVEIEIYEAFVKLPVSLAELIASSPTPTSIQIRRAKIRMLQNEIGDWHVRQLIEQLTGVEQQSGLRIPLIFSDCSIELVSHDSDSITFSDVNLSAIPIEHDGIPKIKVTGQFNSREVSGSKFDLLIDEIKRSWQASIDVPYFRLNPNVLALLPYRYREELSQWPRIMGSISGRALAAGTLDFEGIPKFQCEGHLKDFYCEDPNLPLPVRQASLHFLIDNQSVRITEASGELGNGRFQFGYSQSNSATSPGQPGWYLSGELKDFDFNHLDRFLVWLPPFFEEFQHNHQPAGIADIRFELDHRNPTSKREIHGRLKKMSFTYTKFPYPVENCSGEISLIQDQVKMNVHSENGEQSLTGVGVINNPGPDATYLLAFEIPGSIPIDEKLMEAVNALPPHFSETIQQFNPTGRIRVVGRIEKNQPSGKVSQNYDFDLKHCNIRHDAFPYPVENVNGMIQMRDDRFSFVNLTGSNGGATVSANGQWDEQNGLFAKFYAKSIPLDQRLRDALSDNLQKIWRGFRPRGVVESIGVELTKPIDQPINVVVGVKASKPAAGTETASVSIRPDWFPYEIRQLSGEVQIGNGKIELSDISGQHGRTWLACQGEGSYNDRDWNVTMTNLLVGSLKIDEDFLEAVPDVIAPALRRLSFEGWLNVQGAVAVAGQHQLAQQSFPIQLGWDLRFDMNQAHMRFGIPVENVFGSVRLKGSYDGQRLGCMGQLDLDSLTVYDSQITKLKGPIWMDGSQSAAGVFAVEKATQVVDRGQLPVEFSDEKQASITGNLHGGVFRLDAQVKSDPTGEFYLQTSLSDACLDQLCKDHAPSLNDVSGRSFVALRLQGNSLGTHSFRGSGSIQLRQAQLYELPVVLSLLKSLRVGSRAKTAFDSGNIDFRVIGEEIELTRIEMLGEPISLLGNGKVDLQRNIDLNFYSVMGKNRIHIPVITDLYRASSQQVLWIHIDGTLDSPQTHRHVLPQINDSLKQLFQPVEIPQTARGSQLPWSPPGGRLNQPVIR